jgi:Zn-dependent protease with chaperone function
MTTLHPSRTLYILFGLGTALVFLLGAAVWHAVIQADPPGCTESEIACLFIPTRSDIGIHLISYGLMTPLLAAMFLWFHSWRRQWRLAHALTRNLGSITVRDDRLDKVATSLGLKDKVHLVDSEDFLSFCACLISPQIFISRAVVNTLDAQELEALLLHEKYHLEHRDPLGVLAGNLIISALFFAPVLRDVFQRFLVRKEIAADQFAIRVQGHRRGLIRALQKLLEEETRIETVNLAVGGLEDLKYRIDHILGRAHSERIPFSRIAISSVAPALTILSIVTPLVMLRP